MGSTRGRKGDTAPVPGTGEIPGTHPKRLLVRTPGTIFVLAVDQIRWVGAEGAYVSLHTAERIHEVRASIGRLEQVLPAAQFARIHRSAIVNLDSVSRMLTLPSGKYAVVLDDGTRLVVSRSCRDLLLRRYVSLTDAPEAGAFTGGD